VPSGVPVLPEDASVGGTASMSMSLNSSASSLAEMGGPAPWGLGAALGGGATVPAKRATKKTTEKVIPSPSPVLEAEKGPPPPYPSPSTRSPGLHLSCVNELPPRIYM